MHASSSPGPPRPGGGKATVYAAPASGGAPRALHTGVLDAPFAAGGLPAWREAEASGTATRLSAVSFATLRPAPLPAPLVRLRDFRSPAADTVDGSTCAWIAGEREPKLTVWRTGQPVPVTAVTGAAEGMDQLRVSGDLITWRTPEAAYALDLRSSA